MLNTLILSAQTTSVKGTKTDKVFANTTEIYKSKAASDAQVLAELESDYGIGDVVRISDAPPVSTTVPLSRTTSIQSEKKPLPSIPKTLSANNTATPIENMPIANKETASKTASAPIPQNTNQSTVERKSKAYSPPSVKSSKSNKSYKNTSSSSKKFLFFFNKTSKKSSKRTKLKDNNKFGCYKF